MPDLPRRRSTQGPDWLRRISDRLTTTIKTLVIALTAIYLFYVVVRESRAFMETHLALGPRFFAGELWQPVTSLFIHLDVLSFLFAIIGLVFIGNYFEMMRGSRRCFGLFLVAGVLANLAIAGVFRLRGFAPVSYDSGSSFAVTALFVAAARIANRQPMQLWPTQFMVQARYIVLILLGWQAAAFVTRGNWAHLVGLAVAIVIGFFGAAPGGWTTVGTFFANARDISKARRLRRRFGVLEGGERRPKKYVN